MFQFFKIKFYSNNNIISLTVNQTLNSKYEMCKKNQLSSILLEIILKNLFKVVILFLLIQLLR